MRRATWLATAVLASMVAAPAWAQFKQEDEPAKGTRRGEPQIQRWQFGLTVTAAAGPCKGLVGYVPVPISWPEQQVAVLQEDFSPQVKVRFQTVEGTVRLMVVEVPHLPAGETAKALLTFEVQKYALKPPEKTDVYELADPRRVPRDVRPYLVPSPLIESKNPKIKAALKEAAAGKEKAWEEVEAIYDWVRGKVQFKQVPVKGALAMLREGEGGAEDWTSLFIALCRAADIPARTVWVPGHCYAEFYLLDDEGQGHWFPCELTGNRNFGGINDHRPVIEKGDNFRAPYNRRDRQRFVGEYLEVREALGGKPKHRFIRQAVAQ